MRHAGDLPHRPQFRSTNSGILSQALGERVCKPIALKHVEFLGYKCCMFTRSFPSRKRVQITNKHSHVYIDDRWINQAPEEIHNEKTQNSSDGSKHKVRTLSTYLPRASNPDGSLPDIRLLRIRVRRPGMTQRDSETPPIGLYRSNSLLARSGARSSVGDCPR